MPPKNVLRIFLDTSVIFAAVLSSTGGARKLFHLAKAGLLRLIVSPDVLRECEQVVRRKSPSSLPLLAELLAIGQAETSPAPTSRQLARAKMHVKYLPDAHVLAAAIHAGPDWLVTHDKEHFLKMHAESKLSFRIGTPGDLIQALKDEFVL
jgi:predicted nucleic acid-binding protein